MDRVSPRTPRRPLSVLRSSRFLRIACPPCALALLAVLLLLGLTTHGTTAAHARTGGSVTAAPGAAGSAPGSAVPGGASASAIAATAEAPCGTAGALEAAAVAGVAAERVYAKELASSEVSADRRQIESYAPLSDALRSGNRSAVQSAVTALVYSGTHIVRLRVTSGGRVLSDVGGPYIIAPVRGTISSGGRALASFVFSVQDDLGYVKLEDRFIGVPLLLRTSAGRVPVEGVIPAQGIPSNGPVRFHGGAYEAYSFNGAAFPSGALRITILVPVPAGAATLGCGRVRMLERVAVAQRTWQRFAAIGAGAVSFLPTAASLTGAEVYVRAGSTQLAGSGAGPSHLPDSGTLRWRGSLWQVGSFSAGSGVRVYLLAHA